MSYIELHARSAFSFLRGASIPEEYISIAASQNAPAMALTDVDGVYGSPRFHTAAKKVGIKAHIGAEITCSGRKPLHPPGRIPPGLSESLPPRDPHETARRLEAKPRGRNA